VFQEEIEPELAEDGEYSSLSDWAGKLCGVVLRLAGIIHLADHAANAPNFPVIVSANTLKRAITIGRYLIPHAQSAYAEMGADPLVEDAKYILRWLERERPEKPTRRDIHQGTKGRFRTVVSIDPVIELLIQHGYLRPVGGSAEARRGRKASQPYEINPYFLDTAHNSHNSQKWASNGNLAADSVNFENSENSEKGSEGAELEIDLNEDGEDF
jgi:replicative DNA helicase